MIETIRVDLHCHSSMSDGDHSPAYVAHSLAAVGAVWASLTDHNTLSGQAQFRTVLEKRGVDSVVGLEIDARSPTRGAASAGLRARPARRSLSWTRCAHSVSHGALRPGIGMAGPARLARRAFGRQPRAPTPAEDPRARPTTAEAIRLIHESGGLVFLAHPLAGIGTIGRLEEVLDWLQPEGLNGLEAFHKAVLGRDAGGPARGRGAPGASDCRRQRFPWRASLRRR